MGRQKLNLVPITSPLRKLKRLARALVLGGLMPINPHFVSHKDHQISLHKRTCLFISFFITKPIINLMLLLFIINFNQCLRLRWAFCLFYVIHKLILFNNIYIFFFPNKIVRFDGKDYGNPHDCHVLKRRELCLNTTHICIVVTCWLCTCINWCEFNKVVIYIR